MPDHGDFKLVQPGQRLPHDVGCLCKACMDRRREQAKDPEFVAIVETQAAKLPPEQAKVLREAVLGLPKPWWKTWGRG